MSYSQGSIPALIELLEHVFEDLDVSVSTDQLLSIAGIILNAMSAYTRHYHNLEHVFNFSDPDDPIVHLAALFHDIVYFQVDNGFYKELEPIIDLFIRRDSGHFYLTEKFQPEYKIITIIEKIFEVKPGQEITISSGLNEFLSTLVMVKLLTSIVPEIYLIKAAICIEATIPFRGRNDYGLTHFEVLHNLLTELCLENKIDCQSLNLQETLIRAVVFSNKDVEAFADRDVGKFLENTWKLLPESNISLRSRGIYTIREYRMALQKMDSFLSNLKAEHIFSCYIDTPPQDEFNRMVEQARKNLLTSMIYLRIKLVASVLLEALANFSGGDAPLSLFAGDLPKPAEIAKTLEDFLPLLPIPLFINPETDDVYRLLEIGRTGENSFDSKNSPLSLFMYKSIDKNETERIYNYALEYIEGKINTEDFLAKFPSAVLAAVVKGCASIAITRRNLLLSLI